MSSAELKLQNEPKPSWTRGEEPGRSSTRLASEMINTSAGEKHHSPAAGFSLCTNKVKCTDRCLRRCRPPGRTMTQRASPSTARGQFEEDRRRRREVGEKQEARSKMCVCLSYTKLDVRFGRQAALWRAAKEGEPAGGCQGVYGPMGSEPDVRNTER